VASGPIRIVSNSSVMPPAPAPPVLASEPSVWKGLRLEVHDVPKGELPERISFDRHLLILSYGSDPFRKYWRECGRERSVLVRPGDTALVSHQEIVAHRWDSPCRLIAAGIDDSSLNEILAEELADRATELWMPAISDGVLKRMLIHLKDELAIGCPSGRLYGESILVAMVGYTIPRYGSVRPVLKEYRRGLSTPRLRRVLEYIDGYLGTNLGVAELASVAGLSPYHFGKLFRASMGRSVHQYVLDCRIDRARDLLAGRATDLRAVGALVGLPNASHFSTVFRRRTGVSPSSYTKLLGWT
jgi:AraC family transcriptional regulator